ncbi:MAG: hypothetical protein BWY06_01234 [Candidatus Latescibacteria bacterium ADurb.Bin168]|nr:MAG: hypothetical protein BWY06_01234 [Candidatus Latescibacteria bacterium ADurb.Bin168]
MGTNYHTAYAAGVTGFTAALMGAPLSELDRAVTYHKTAFVGCDGTVSYDNTTGVLTWSGTINIYFTRADGTAIKNTVAAGSITLADDEFCYVTLSETNGAALTMAKASLGAGSASAFKAYNVLPMGYRNASDNNFYPEELAGVFAMMLAGSAYVEKATFDANTILKADTDNTPAALTVAEQRIVGRKTGGNIAALTGSEVNTILEQRSTLNFIIDGGGSKITSGEKGHLVVDFACTIEAWTLLADQSGAIKIDIWKDSYSNFPPTDSDSICNGHEPEISASGSKAQDTDLSDWGSVSINAGDILAFNVDSCTSITRCTVALKVKRA